MEARRSRLALIALAAALVAAATPESSPALSNGFSYQGRIEIGGVPYDGHCDLRFRLYDAPAGGMQLQAQINAGTVVVDHGLFSVVLDFGGAFNGSDRWLEIDARCPDGGGAFTPLSPRQQLSATPYALYAGSSTWAGIADKPAGFADGEDDDAVGGLNCELGQVAFWDGGGWDCLTPFSPAAGTGIDVDDPGEISLLPGYRLPQGCAVGEVVRSLGGNAWQCSTDQDSGGDITAVTAGAGLQGGGLSGSVALSLSFAGTGVADTAARSDHDHFDSLWEGTGTGLVVRNLAPATNASTIIGLQGDMPFVVVAVATGVLGLSENGFGVRGVGEVGVQGTGDDAGVIGKAGFGPGVDGMHDGAGTDPGVRGETTSSDAGAIGVLGVISSTTPGSFSAAVRGMNAGTLGAGIGVWGSHEGNGWGVYGMSDGGRGVYGSTETGFGIYAQSTNGVALRTQTTTGTPFEAYVGANRRFYVATNGDVFADGAFNPGGADFAELLPAADELEPGDVLVIDGDGSLIRSSQPRQRNVAGVYSTKPGVLGGASEDEDASGKVPLAVIGVVPVKASAENGAIHAGDLLTTSSTPGHAMRAGDDALVGSIIGKALASVDAGTARIRMLVTLQ